MNPHVQTPNETGAEYRENPPEAPILVVDDDASNLFAVREALSDLGQPVICAQSGDEALRQLLRKDFALILLDVSMPGLDGYETAKMIRAREKSRRVPIIFLSALNKDPAHLFRGYSAGAVDYVFKPVSPTILRSKVAVFIELHNKIDEVRRQAELEQRLQAENLEVRRKQSQTAEALHRSEKQQSLVIQSLPLALYVSYPEDGFQSREFVGGLMEGLCGFNASNFSRKRKVWLSRIHEDDKPLVLEALQEAAETGTFYVEYRWRCADGSFRWFSDQGTLTHAKDGPGELFGLWLDISERRALEQQLAHAQKIEVIGRMTGAIAHDFNNLLSVILGSLHLLEKSGIDDPKNKRRLELALQAARSCSDMTKRLLGFARQQPLEPAVLAVEDEIGRLKDLVIQTLKGGITLKIECPGDIWPIYTDRSQLESAIINLAVNAADAMAQGGDLTFSAANRAIDGPRAAELLVEAGDYVELAVADNGTGMTDDVVQRAFEPFFTTKQTKGTGLGLSSIQSFVKQSGGAVTIESEVGKGTVVRLYLPRAWRTDQPERVVNGARLAPEFLEGLTVLVVDDEDGVREIALSIFQAMGCKTVGAADADEALRHLDKGLAISLLFTDCIMPGSLDGPQLAEEVTRRQPGVAVLLTSAFRDASSRNSKYHFLAKPYTAPDLEAALSELLAESPKAGRRDETGS